MTDTAAPWREPASFSDASSELMRKNECASSAHAGPANNRSVVKSEQCASPAELLGLYAMDTGQECDRAAAGVVFDDKRCGRLVDKFDESSSRNFIRSGLDGTEPETVPRHVQYPQPSLPLHGRNPQFGSAKSPKSYWLRRHSDSLQVASLSSTSTSSSPSNQPGLFFSDGCSTSVDNAQDASVQYRTETDEESRRLEAPLFDLQAADSDDVFEDSMPDRKSPIAVYRRGVALCFADLDQTGFASRGSFPPSSPVLVNMVRRNDGRKSVRLSVNEDDLPSIVEDSEERTWTSQQYFESVSNGVGGKMLPWQLQPERTPITSGAFLESHSYQEKCASDEQALNLSPASRSSSGQMNFSALPPSCLDRSPKGDHTIDQHSAKPSSPRRQHRALSAGSRQRRHASLSAVEAPAGLLSAPTLDDQSRSDAESSRTSATPSSSTTPGRSHRCTVCRRSFSRSDMLERHVRLHTGIRPYACRLCSQVFSRSDHLTTHLRTHTGEKPYSCPRCSYSASRRDMVTRHLRVHMQEGVGQLEVGSTSLHQPASAFNTGVVVEAAHSLRCARGQLRNRDNIRRQPKASAAGRLSIAGVPSNETNRLNHGSPWMTGVESDVVAIRAEKVPSTSVIVRPLRSSPTFSDSVGRQLERELAPGRRGLSLILAGHGSTGSTDSYSSIGLGGGDSLETGGIAEGSPDVFRSPLSATRQAFKFMWPYDPSPLPASCGALAFFQQ